MVVNKANKNIFCWFIAIIIRSLFIIILINFTYKNYIPVNFLAHAYLSGDNENILFGNFIADAVKGRAFNLYPEQVQRGIQLHRMIDHYTDSHRLFKSSKKRLTNNYGKFASVIVDIFYDHYLARNWNNYSDIELNEFVSGTYKILIKNFSLLPAKSKKILPFMISQNWLVGYANFDGLTRVFNGMSRRTKKYNSGMEHAVASLQKDYMLYHHEFTGFFPELINHVEEIRVNLKIK